MDWVNSHPKFPCSINRDGKVFLFGNTIGFATYDATTAFWSARQPIFTPPVSMASLLNQEGMAAEVWPDGYTICIFATGTPMYMQLNSQSMTMDGIPVPIFPPSLHGFCMGVVQGIPPNLPTPVVCGGSING